MYASAIEACNVALLCVNLAMPINDEYFIHYMVCRDDRSRLKCTTVNPRNIDVYRVRDPCEYTTVIIIEPDRVKDILRHANVPTKPPGYILHLYNIIEVINNFLLVPVLINHCYEGYECSGHLTSDVDIIMKNMLAFFP